MYFFLTHTVYLIVNSALYMQLEVEILISLREFVSNSVSLDRILHQSYQEASNDKIPFFRSITVALAVAFKWITVHYSLIV